MRFTTTMFLMGNNTGIEIPPEVIDALGGGKRLPVHVTVDRYAYRSTVAVMGGRSLIPFSSDKRRETGIAGGDEVTVEVTLDTEPRTVDVPTDLAAALAAVPSATEAFGVLSPSARKAHVTSVEGARTDATRRRRIESIVAKVRG